MSDIPNDIERLSKAVNDILPRAHSNLVLVSSSRLERYLVQIIYGHMPNLSNRTKETLFKGYGPLATFSSKIDIAYALDLITDQDRTVLVAIKKIRNAFAHSDDHDLNLGHAEIRGFFSVLPKPYASQPYSHQHFVEVCNTCAKSLNKKIEIQLLTKTLKSLPAKKEASDGESELPSPLHPPHVLDDN